MARQRQHSAQGAPAHEAGTLPRDRTDAPLPANDNSNPSVPHIVLIACAIVMAIAVALLALRPFD